MLITQNNTAARILRKKLGLILFVVGVFLSFALYSNIKAARIIPLASLKAAPGVKTVYFVPIGTFSAVSVDGLANYFSKKLGFPIKSLPSVQIGSTAVDEDRQQLIAEELLILMKRQCPIQVSDPGVILIGVTENDMFIRNSDWKFAFSYREDNRFAVISSARMRFPNKKELRKNPKIDLYSYVSPKHMSRLDKMIAKNLGIMYYRLPASNNRRSVLYKSILGVDELDTINEKF